MFSHSFFFFLSAILSFFLSFLANQPPCEYDDAHHLVSFLSYIFIFIYSFFSFFHSLLFFSSLSSLNHLSISSLLYLLRLLGTYRSRRKGGRAGARALGQSSLLSPNLDALLQRTNLSLYGGGLEDTRADSTGDDQAVRDLDSKIDMSRTEPGSKSISLPGIPNSSTASLSEAAKRANLMHNMRKVERIELLTNKRKDR